MSETDMPKIWTWRSAIASCLPRAWEAGMRRGYYGWQIRRRKFRSDETEYDLLGTLVSTGDWVLDIGANVGHYTLELARLVGPLGRVIAFEPVPETFSLLAANVRAASLNNVTLLNVAVSDRCELVGVVVPEGQTGLDGHYFAHVAPVAETSELRSLSMAVDQVQLPAPIRLAKIDVEGHEPHVLRGMQDLLMRDRPTLIVEAGNSQTRQLLESLGYAVHQDEESANFLCSACGR